MVTHKMEWTKLLRYCWYLVQILIGHSVFRQIIYFVAFRFGAIFNMARLVVDDFRSGFEKGPWWSRLFDGYSISTWMVVLNLGSSGLLVSWLMKYADNIVKVKFLGFKTGIHLFFSVLFYMIWTSLHVCWQARSFSKRFKISLNLICLKYLG